MRVLAPILFAVVALAFAPAPFPRSQREPPGDDLLRLQGKWLRTTFNGKPEESPALVTIAGNRMQYPTPDDAWLITLDAKRSPKHVDFVNVKNKTSSFRGVYRLQGDTLTCSLLMNVPVAERPLDFDVDRAKAWVEVFERQKP